MIAGGSLGRVVIGRGKLFLNSRVEKLRCYLAITRASGFRLSLLFDFMFMIRNIFKRRNSFYPEKKINETKLFKCNLLLSVNIYF